MANKFVTVITGPAGSGKSTVANKLAKQLTKCVNIEVDHIKHFVVSGFKYDLAPDGTKQWRFEEWQLVGDSIGLLARNFHEIGYNVIINGYMDEDGWEATVKHIELTHKFLLLPDTKTVVDRDADRPGDLPMGKETVLKHHNDFSNNKFYDDFTKIDSTNHTTEATVEIIAKQLKQF